MPCNFIILIDNTSSGGDFVVVRKYSVQASNKEITMSEFRTRYNLYNAAWEKPHYTILENTGHIVPLKGIWVPAFVHHKPRTHR